MAKQPAEEATERALANAAKTSRTYMERRSFDAMMVARQAAHMVEMRLMEEIRSNPDGWMHIELGLSFITDSKFGHPPILKRISGRSAS